MKQDETKPNEGIPDTGQDTPAAEDSSDAGQDNTADDNAVTGDKRPSEATVSGVAEDVPGAESIPGPGEENPVAEKDRGDAEEDSDGDSEENPDDQRATLLSHLLALRKVLLISFASVVAAFFLVYSLAIDPLMSWIIDPIRARGIEIIYTAMSEALVTKFKVALIAGFIVAFPVIIWQLWSFIKPALYPKEKRAFRVLFSLSLLLFLTGVVFCYFAVYTLAVDFFLVAGDNLATPMLSIDKYVGFLFGFIVPFGIAFLLPIALYLTTRMGWTNYRSLSSKRKYVILGIFVLAAILTPPDVVSQVALGVPLCILYEISVQVARLTKPRERE